MVPPPGDCGLPGAVGGLKVGPLRGPGRGVLGRAVGRAPPELGAAPHQPALARCGDPSKVASATVRLTVAVSSVFFMGSSPSLRCDPAPLPWTVVFLRKRRTWMSLHLSLEGDCNQRVYGATLARGSLPGVTNSRHVGTSFSASHWLCHGSVVVADPRSGALYCPRDRPWIHKSFEQAAVR